MAATSDSARPARRSERSRRATLDAVFDLTVRRGYAAVTVEAIAAAAGVGKPTIYRWWPSKGALALEAISDRVGGVLDFPDTGDIAADLTSQITALVTLLNSGFGTVYRGVIAEAQGDPDLAAALRDTVVEPRSRVCQDRLAKAVAEGQLRGDVPVRVMVELLYAPVYYRFLLGTDPLSPRQVPGQVEAVLAGLRPPA
ncbi:TetR/AcrR family transcriptional regulator [Streptomonospora nanhaiensis]|uniref:AcrR family transcriptional regulator n=1 Tax=Streptomonospora nanhaiensis TaxID=1323731 RepID=A0A853BIN1_9ACTN|nr:TetR/AcrR family transcriptional regulator [Streptomonospora nanhaiensis]MBV2364179.1 TetR/AcrR family transcriptional regulator [Streptomonospora nanhaiensis]MBX9386701.1 TetR/AcrR family transcriptional regulator [Streptomonospora nanhaiensis]NYI95133.1 AcrR family transcriptional regulator [Streptomonospora nanhaiensis]